MKKEKKKRKVYDGGSRVQRLVRVVLIGAHPDPQPEPLDPKP